MIGIQMDRTDFRSKFASMLDLAKNPRALLAVAGRELANRLKDHFRRKDVEEPNKLSPRRQHFWLAVSRSVQSPVVDGARTVSVTVNDPRFAQKVFGGKITAKRAKALTVPVTEKAYGRTTATFEKETGLKLFLLGRKDHGRGGVLAAKIGDQIEVEYVLTKSVTQQADPTALPPESDLEKAILDRVQGVVDRQLKE
jgi:hypothetical protein